MVTTRAPRRLLSDGLRGFLPLMPLAFAAAAVLSQCSQGVTVSLNDQSLYDPDSRLLASDSLDADLQGCINIALRQQGLESADRLGVLSCTHSGIARLDNIGRLSQLRFLDLANNEISNITPLERLANLSGANLANNRIRNVRPLFNLSALTVVDLTGNNEIPCAQLAILRTRLGDNLRVPERCGE